MEQDLKDAVVDTDAFLSNHWIGQSIFHRRWTNGLKKADDTLVNHGGDYYFVTNGQIAFRHEDAEDYIPTTFFVTSRHQNKDNNLKRNKHVPVFLHC